MRKNYFMYTNNDLMDFESMKSLMAVACFSIMMCIIAMCTLNGCCRSDMNKSIDSLMDTVEVVDTIDSNIVHVDSIKPFKPNYDSCLVAQK